MSLLLACNCSTVYNYFGLRQCGLSDCAYFFAFVVFFFWIVAFGYGMWPCLGVLLPVIDRMDILSAFGLCFLYAAIAAFVLSRYRGAFLLCSMPQEML